MIKINFLRIKSSISNVVLKKYLFSKNKNLNSVKLYSVIKISTMNKYSNSKLTRNKNCPFDNKINSKWIVNFIHFKMPTTFVNKFKR